MLRLIGIDQPSAWRKALEGLPHGYWHTWEACNAVAVGTGLRVFLYSHEDVASASRAVVPFAERNFGEYTDIFTPIGFSGFIGTGDLSLLRTCWRKFIVDRGYVCGYFALHPIHANAALHSDLTVSNLLYVLDLSDGATAALKRADPDVRRVLRKWTATGGQVVTDRDQICKFATEHYARFMTSVGANPAAIWSEACLKAMLADENVFLAGVSDCEGICGIYTFATTSWSADAHLSISIRDGRRFITPLIAWGIHAMADRGISSLNLGGGVRPGDAVARAKHKFGPDRFPLRAARETYRPDIYRHLCAVMGRDPEEPIDFFPKYRARASGHV
jgi:hypothetical protein